MAIKIRKNLVATSKYPIKCPYDMDAQYITFHNTYNDASADAEVRYMIGNTNEVSFHIAVDDKEAVQGLPLNRNAWHCGDGSGNGNRKSIGVEVCYSLSGGDRYTKAEENAVQVIAQLLAERGWGVDRVKTHKYWTEVGVKNGNSRYVKNCPHRVLDEGRWSSVVSRIQQALNANGGGSSTPSEPTVSNDGSIGEVTVLVDELNIREDASFDAKVVKTVKKGEVYVVWAEKNGLYNLGGKQWCSAGEAFVSFKAYAKPVVPPAVDNIAHGDDVYGVVTVLADSLNVREQADFNSAVVKTIKKGEAYKVFALKNGLYNLGGNQWCSSNEQYVHFEKNANYGTPQYVRVLASELYTYNSADWNDKGSIVKKGEVFTITKELMVNGSKMYRLKSGAYITANPNFVSLA